MVRLLTRHLAWCAWRAGALAVVYQHAGTLVVDKPAGLSSEQRDAHGESAIRWVRTELGFPDAQLPHRLDRLTSGVLVVATDREALARQNAAIAAGEWGPKVYLARLRARRVEPGERRLYLKRRGKRAVVVRAGGKPSVLKVLFAAPSSAETVDAVIQLETGRYHQIRATLAHEGAPVLGDDLYGGGDAPRARLCHAALGGLVGAGLLRSRFDRDFCREARAFLDEYLEEEEGLLL